MMVAFLCRLHRISSVYWLSGYLDFNFVREEKEDSSCPLSICFHCADLQHHISRQYLSIIYTALTIKEIIMSSHGKASPMALGLALGVVWGVSVFLMGLSAHYFSYGVTFVESLQTLYIGYDISIGGAFVGGLIGFFDAFFFGLIVGWLYNVFSRCCCRKDEHCN